MEENIRKRMCDNLTSLQGSIIRDEPHEVVRELMKRFTEDYLSVYGDPIPMDTVKKTDGLEVKIPQPKKSLRGIFMDCLGKY